MESKNLKFAIAGAKALFYLKILKKNYPLALRWQLTDRCPNRCRYCGLWKKPRKEMTLDEIKTILNEVKKAGTIRISFSGGEPLLREDIYEIIKYTKNLGISPSINTCGFLFEKRKKTIKLLDLVKISVDGKEETHNFLSGREGSFKEAIKAVELAKEWNVKTVLTVTISKYNLSDVDFLLELAEKYKVLVAFQPYKIMYKGTKDKELYPEKEKYRRVIRKLIYLKKKGFPYLRNSLLNLYHILEYPDFPDFRCAAGKLFSIIDVDGTLLPCDRNDGKIKGKLSNVKEEGYLECFRKLPEVECSGCGFLGAKELSYFMEFKLKGFKDVKRFI